MSAWKHTCAAVAVGLAVTSQAVAAASDADLARDVTQTAWLVPASETHIGSRASGWGHMFDGAVARDTREMRADDLALVRDDAPAARTSARRFSWPTWFRIDFQYRGRIESERDAVAPATPYHAFYLNRLRATATWQPATWFTGVAEAHDARVAGWGDEPKPRNLVDIVDLRQAYVDVAGRGLFARVGRQAYTMGAGRLVASPDWANASRPFDLARAGFRRPGTLVEAFAGWPVNIAPRTYDPHVAGERLYGVHATFGRLTRGVTWEPFAVRRTQGHAVSERGQAGSSTRDTFGLRTVARAGPHVDVGTETAWQRGRTAGDAIGAWASHHVAGWTVETWSGTPRFFVEYNVASGDRHPDDGHAGTFDTLYNAAHAKHGEADVVGGRNLHDVAVGIDVAPRASVEATASVHRFWLYTVNDAFYATSGAAQVRFPEATSRSLGWEIDGVVSYAVSRELSLNAGIGIFFAGAFIDQASGSTRMWAPFLSWTVKF